MFRCDMIQRYAHRVGFRGWRSGAVAFAVALAASVPLGAIAQEVPPPQELNPLTLQEPDPLFPDLTLDRPLSESERNVLGAALDELQNQAQREFDQGNIPGAFELWVRELRLRRLMGPTEEVAALRRVGEVAWRENQRIELRFITLRLQEIEQETLAQTPVDNDLLVQIAQAYQALRAQEPAIAAYERLLQRATEQRNTVQMREYLTALGELHVAWFDYTRAAIAYQELVTLAQQTGDESGELDAMRQLAYVYEQDRQYELAIITQDQLIARYRDRDELEPLTVLKLAIAENYLALDRPDLAAVHYQEAFALARSNEQLGYAGDALRRLAELYLSLDRLDDALIVYELLVDVEQQSYSSYGMMDAYDHIGQIYRTQGATSQAIAAFQQGLRLARELSYREDYFINQINGLQGQSGT